ncbi:MAG: hypothetical protein K2Y31_14810 [Burkholderiales bacterium]|jgi:hypothetical protein|nr:hypothetical protein [Burkholderiales bacterium]
MHNPSNRRILSSGLVAEIEHCAGCEIMHLHIGAFTLRMKPVALHDLRDTLSRALAALPAHDQESTMQQTAGMQPPGGSCH